MPGTGQRSFGLFSEKKPNLPEVTEHAGTQSAAWVRRQGDNHRQQIIYVAALLTAYCFLTAATAENPQVYLSFTDPDLTSNYKFTYNRDQFEPGFFDEVGETILQGLCGANTSALVPMAMSLFNYVHEWTAGEQKGILYRQWGVTTNQTFEDCLTNQITSMTKDYNELHTDPNLNLLRYILGLGGGLMLLFCFPLLALGIRLCGKSGSFGGESLPSRSGAIDDASGVEPLDGHDALPDVPAEAAVTSSSV